MVTKFLLTDVDGVLLDFNQGFVDYFAKYHPEISVDKDQYDFGLPEESVYHYLQEFNNSPEFGQLQPYKDAKEMVIGLNKLGYQFVAITTCLGTDTTEVLRKNNLRQVFGKNVFYDIICLPIGSSKLAALMRFAPTVYIDDKMKHALSAVSAGHKALEMIHPYNENDQNDLVTSVNNWKQIFQLIKK